MTDRQAPTVEDVTAEAEDFHAAAAALMDEMAALRAEISETAVDLRSFAEQLREATR